MFNDKIPKPKLQTEGYSVGDALAALGPEELLTLRANIDVLLPNMALSDLNLEQELVIQYNTVKLLQSTILSDSEIPASQRAQVANTCASTLAQLTKMQTDYYTAERLKMIETALIRLLRSWPNELAVKFFEEYEAIDR